jgi:prefoldin alpha subunit
MPNEDMIIKLSLLEQQSEELKKRLETINSQISDLESLKASLEKLEKNKEILSPLGRGIFIKTEVRDDELYVNVGNKVIVRKGFKDTAAIIEKQVKELEEIKIVTSGQMDEITCLLQGLMQEASTQVQDQ